MNPILLQMTRICIFITLTDDVDVWESTHTTHSRCFFFLLKLIVSCSYECGKALERSVVPHTSPAPWDLTGWSGRRTWRRVWCAITSIAGAGSDARKATLIGTSTGPAWVQLGRYSIQTQDIVCTTCSWSTTSPIILNWRGRFKINHRNNYYQRKRS